MIICINFTIVGIFLSFAINANNHFSFTLSFFYSRIEKIMNTYSTIRFTEEYMKEKIIKVRTFLLRHFKNQYLQTLIMGLISYEMLSYMFFGLGTCIVDYGVFSSITAMGLDELIDTLCNIVCLCYEQALGFQEQNPRFRGSIWGIFEICQCENLYISYD